MAGDHGVNEAQFTGLSKHFNTFTTRGRANISAATISTVAVIALYYKLKPKKAAPADKAAAK